MGREFEEHNILEMMQEIAGIDQDYWQDGERHILASSEAPQVLKGDFAAILEVTNHVYENDIPKAIEAFKELTESQQELLAVLVYRVTGECDCPHCAAERAEDEEMIKRRDEAEISRQHFREMQAISRNKTYEVSEDLYETLLRAKSSVEYIRGKLEMILELVDESDPRAELASRLLDDIYYS